MSEPDSSVPDGFRQHISTIKEIKSLVREFIRNNEDRWPNVWVLTDDEYRKLVLLCEKRRPDVVWNGLPKEPWTIYGIRIEHLPTREQVRARVFELAENGVKAGFLQEE